MLHNTIYSATTKNPLEIVGWVHKIYTLRLPHNMVSSSIGTSLSFMRATTDKLDTGSVYDIIVRSAFPQDWQRHVCLYYENPPVGNANGNPLLILSAIILRIKFGSAV